MCKRLCSSKRVLVELDVAAGELAGNKRTAYGNNGKDYNMSSRR